MKLAARRLKLAACGLKLCPEPELVLVSRHLRQNSSCFILENPVYLAGGWGWRRVLIPHPRPGAGLRPACGLELVACSLVIFFIFFLMFAITDIRNSFIPALPAAPAFIALSRCWAAVLFVCLHGRCPGPALNRSLVDHMRGHTND